MTAQCGAPYIWGYGQSVAEDWINPGLDKVKINIGYLDFIHTFHTLPTQVVWINYR